MFLVDTNANFFTHIHENYMYLYSELNLCTCTHIPDSFNQTTNLTLSSRECNVAAEMVLMKGLQGPVPQRFTHNLKYDSWHLGQQ